MCSRPTRNVMLQVLWNGVDNAVPNLFLFTDKRSEGLQRLFLQWKLRFGKLDAFFLTQYQWSHIGGLPGIGMTLRDIKSKKRLEQEKLNIQKKSKNHDTQHINVFAPQGMKRVVDATQNFMRFDKSGIRFNVIECLKDEKTYRDEEMIIYPIPLTDVNKPKNPNSFCSINKNFESVNISPSSTPCSLCYACHLHPYPGKFYPEKAAKLGVPRGPMYSRLSKGSKIKLHNGIEITPDQVMDPPEPGPVILIIDCPSKTHIDNLEENTMLSKYHISKDHHPHMIIHLTKQNVCEDAKYKAWLKKFPSASQHIYLNKLSQENQVFQTQHGFQLLLNSINNKLFPLLNDDIATHANKVKLEDKGILKNLCKLNLRNLICKPEEIIELNSLQDSTHLQFKLERILMEQNHLSQQSLHAIQQPISNSEMTCENNISCKDTNINELKRKRLIDNDMLNIAKKRYVGNDSDVDTCSDEFPKIICLGTGASIPSKLRNVSATLLFLNADTAVLFDCGEGTYGQLCRHYGDNIDNILKKIKVILVSHMHADHHLGLISLLKKFDTIHKIADDTIVLVGPNLLLKWLKEYAYVSEKLKFKFLQCNDCFNATEVKFGLWIQSVPVNHPGHAVGFVIQSDDTKITYSGDTTPCDTLVRAGMDSTVLIHEATIADDLPEEAAARKHSTTSQALDVAIQMRARHVVLTHFSQRYPRMPELKDTNLAKHTVFAFDHMEVNLKDIPKFHEVLPLLTKLLAETYE